MARRLARRIGKYALVAALVAGAALAGVNLYLNGEYLPRLIKSQQDWVTLDYAFAWTVWPGRVHLEGIRVRGEERALTWEVTADRASLVADLGGLASQRLDVDLLTLSGVRARVRPRLFYLDATGDRLRALPDLATRGPAYLPLGPEAPDAARKARAPWAVDLARVEVRDLEELWVDRYRFEGELHAQGSLAVREGRVLSTGPVLVEVEEGTVQVDGKDVVRGLTGTGTSRLDPVDLGLRRGLELLGTLSGKAALEGQVVALDFLPGVEALPVPIEIAGARGPVKTTVSIEKGEIQAGATLSWSAPEAALSLAGFSARGPLTLKAEVLEVDGGLRTRCTATVEDFTLGREGKDPPFARGRTVRFTLDAPNVDLANAQRFDRQLTQALSEWPGQLQLKGARVQGRERALEWVATFDRLDSKLNVAALYQRRIHFVSPRAEGVTARIRPRILAAEAKGASVPYFPPIDGFAKVPLRTGAPPRPLAQRAGQNPWSIRAEDAEVEGLREVWLDQYRFEGEADARGGFHYEAGGRLRAGPIVTTVTGGTLKIARYHVASKLRGDVEVTVLPFDLQVPEGYGFFRYLTARGGLEGLLDDVAFVKEFPAVPFPALLGGGEGTVRAKVAVREGVVQAGSEVAYDTKSIQVSTHGYRFFGPLALRAVWTDRNGEPRLRLQGEVSPYKVTRVGSEVALVGGRMATLRMDTAPFDLADPVFEPFSVAQIKDGRVYDLRELNRFIPGDLPLKLDGGGGTFSGRVNFTHRGYATAEVHVSGEDAKLVYDRVRIQGNWDISARLSSVDMTTGEAEIDEGKLVLNDMAMREGAHVREGWFGRFEMKNGHLRPRGPIILEGDLQTTMRDGRPLVAFFVAETDMLPVWARTLITLQALVATARFRIGDGVVEVDRLNARGQSMEIRGRLRKKGTLQWGDMLVMSRGQDVGLALRGRRVEFKLIGAAAWYRQQMLNPRW